MLRLNFPSRCILAPLFGGTLISCGWSSEAPRAGALSVFWTVAIPRLSAFQRALSIFARCYSRNTYPFLPVVYIALRVSRCYHAPVPSGSIKILYDSHLPWKNSFADVWPCLSKWASTLAINKLFSCVSNADSTVGFYLSVSSGVDGFPTIYMHHSRPRVRITWNSC